MSLHKAVQFAPKRGEHSAIKGIVWKESSLGVFDPSAHSLMTLSSIRSDLEKCRVAWAGREDVLGSWPCS